MDQFTFDWANYLLSFSAGLGAAFSPCVIILIPMLLAQVAQIDQKKYIFLPQLLIGFIASFAMLGLCIGELMKSSFQSGVRIGLGLLFVTLGTNSFLGKVRGLSYSLLQNPLLLGGVFAVLVSYNPCTIPYIGAMISLYDKDLVIHLFIFSLGLIVPAFIFSTFGGTVLTFVQTKFSTAFHWFNKFMALVNIGSGVYLTSSIHSITGVDLLVASVTIACCYYLIFKNYFDESIFSGRRTDDTPESEVRRTIVVVLLMFFLVITVSVFLGFALKYRDKFFNVALSEEIEALRNMTKKISKGEDEDSDGEKMFDGDEVDLDGDSDDEVGGGKGKKKGGNKGDDDDKNDVIDDDGDDNGDKKGKTKRKGKEKEEKEKKKKSKDLNFDEDLDPLASLDDDSSGNAEAPLSDTPLGGGGDADAGAGTGTTGKGKGGKVGEEDNKRNHVKVDDVDTALKKMPKKLDCQVYAPCPECVLTWAVYVGALFVGLVLLIALAVKREDFSGIVHDVCAVPKRKRQKKPAARPAPTSTTTTATVAGSSSSEPSPASSSSAPSLASSPSSPSSSSSTSPSTRADQPPPAAAEGSGAEKEKEGEVGGVGVAKTEGEGQGKEDAKKSALSSTSTADGKGEQKKKQSKKKSEKKNK